MAKFMFHGSVGFLRGEFRAPEQIHFNARCRQSGWRHLMITMGNVQPGFMASVPLQHIGVKSISNCCTANKPTTAVVLFHLKSDILSLEKKLGQNKIGTVILFAVRYIQQNDFKSDNRLYQCFLYIFFTLSRLRPKMTSHKNAALIILDISFTCIFGHLLLLNSVRGAPCDSKTTC